jgi:Tfp pilus assembly protein PilF
MKIPGSFLYSAKQSMYQTRMLRPRSIGLLLGFLTLLVYLPATSFDFIDFDDPDYVTDNSFVQNGLTLSGIKWAFSGAHASNWHPLTWLSHMADCDLFRLNPAGPHLVNIMFHAANTTLLFMLLFRLTEKLWPSAFVAALFAWHPLHVESVAWVSERKDVLSTFFALLTLLSYIFYARQNCRRSFGFALLFFALALLSKPMPVTLPLVMLLLDYWPLNRVATRRSAVEGAGLGEMPRSSPWLLIREKWLFFLLAAALCMVTVLAQHDAVSSLKIVPFNLRLENAIVAYGGYLWKMIWPLQLCIFYPLELPVAWSLIAASLVILAGVSIIVWLERQCQPWLIVGWLWFLVTLVPVIGLVQVGAQSMADRYTYFPLIGIFLAVAFSAQAFIAHFQRLEKWLALMAILILGACILVTENQLRYWHDSETLFTHALEVKDSAMAHASLGAVLQGQNKPSEAMTQYIMALRLDPELDSAYWNLAKLFGEEGKLELAAVYYREAVKRKPISPVPYDNLGVILAELKRPDEAMQAFSSAARVDPTATQPHFLMGRLLLQEGQDAEAVVQLHKALQLDPDDPQILIYTAGILAADQNEVVRNAREARALAEEAVKITNGQQSAALDVLAMSRAEAGDFGGATLIQMQAIKLARAVGQADDLALMQQRLELYEKHQPWRESFRVN